MKKLLLSLFICLNIVGCELPEAKSIVPYELCHKDAVVEIAFEDALKLFGGSVAVNAGLMTEEDFNAENKKGMQAILADPLRVTKVLLVENAVAGFIEFCKMRETSIESMLKIMVAQGLPTCDPEQIAAVMPHIKKTDAECKEYALIECLAVSKKCRGKGYGKALLLDAQDAIKKRWPAIDQVRLAVNESNPVARKLYETQGFIPNPGQLPHLSMMKMVEYQKSI